MVATAAAGPWDLTALVVASTGIGLSKTVVVVALVALVHARGERVAVVKPAQTGAGPGEPGEFEEMRRLAGVEDLHELARLAEPPATAARRTGSPAVPGVAAAVEALHARPRADRRRRGQLGLRRGRRDDRRRRRGAAGGGARCRPRGTRDAQPGRAAGEALRARGRACRGVVVGAWPAAPDLAARCNLEELRAGTPMLARLPGGGGGMDPAAFLAVARAGLAPALGGAGSLVDRSRPEVHA